MKKLNYFVINQIKLDEKILKSRTDPRSPNYSRKALLELRKRLRIAQFIFIMILTTAIVILFFAILVSYHAYIDRLMLSYSLGAGQPRQEVAEMQSFIN